MTEEIIPEADDTQQDLWSKIFSTVNWIKHSPLYQQYVQKYPLLSVSFIIITCLSLIPILTFTCFVLVTFMVTIAGFLFVEGTLLAVAVVILSGTLFAIGMFTAGFTMCVAVVLFVMRKVHLFFSSRQFFFYSGEIYKEKRLKAESSEKDMNNDTIK